MLSPQYVLSAVFSLAMHACILWALLSIGHRQTINLQERREEAEAPYRLAREAEAERQRSEEQELQQEELGDAVLEELEAFLQEGLSDAEREWLQAESERFLREQRESGSFSSVDSLVPEFFELSVSNLQAYLAALYAQDKDARLEALLARLGRFDEVPETFRLGHTTFRYDEATRPLEEHGVDSEHHQEGPDLGPGRPAPPGELFRFGGAQSSASDGVSSGPSEDMGGTPFEDTYNRYAGVNHDVYGLYSSFVSRRSTNNPAQQPDAALALDEFAVSRVRTESGAYVTDRIFVEQGEQRRRSSTDGVQRTLARPRFETLAHGVAEFQRTPLVIDGRLDDWGELRHPVRMRWSFDGVPLKQGIPVWVRWSHAGVYFCYVVRGRTTVQPNTTSNWEGDCFEVWIDVENRRERTMHTSPFSQQFCFMPFGYKGVRTHTFSETGRGFRGFGQYEVRVETESDPGRALGISAGRVDEKGYTVEGFVSRRALARSTLRAGMYVAMNVSINTGYDRSTSQQWSLPKNMQTFDKPDTWGDLLLLGTDATARFTDAADPSIPARPVLAGQSMGIEVVDHDMNLDPGRLDRAMVSVREKGARSYLYAVLEETGMDTGVFRGAVSTQAAFLPARVNSLGIRAGRSMHLLYKDRHSSYGQKDRIVESEITMATHVQSMPKVAHVTRKESSL